MKQENIRLVNLESKNNILYYSSGAIILSPPKAKSSRFSPLHEITPGPG